MKIRLLNLKRIVKLGILAAFLFSWTAAANATVLCQCEEGHIAIENIYTGYCDIDFSHDHGADGHSDLTCDCEDTPITIENASLSQKIDIDFNYSQPIVGADVELKVSSLDQNYIAYVLSKERLTYNLKNPLSTIILII